MPDSDGSNAHQDDEEDDKAPNHDALSVRSVFSGCEVSFCGPGGFYSAPATHNRIILVMVPLARPILTSASSRCSFAFWSCILWPTSVLSVSPPICSFSSASRCALSSRPDDELSVWVDCKRRARWAAVWERDETSSSSSSSSSDPIGYAASAGRLDKRRSRSETVASEVCLRRQAFANRVSQYVPKEAPLRSRTARVWVWERYEMKN